MFVCEKDAGQDELINNTVTSIFLPKLIHSHISLHQICGNDVQDTSNAMHNCEVTFSLIKKNADGQEVPFYSIPSERIHNDGRLNDVSEMFYEVIKLPLVDPGDQLRIIASFNAQKGAFGFDNFRFGTNQRYKTISK